jgi:hypothetical protein
LEFLRRETGAEDIHETLQLAAHALDIPRLKDHKAGREGSVRRADQHLGILASFASWKTLNSRSKINFMTQMTQMTLISRTFGTAARLTAGSPREVDIMDFTGAVSAARA